MKTVLLVAHREFFTKTKSKSWLWTTGSTLALIVVLCIGVQFLDSDDSSTIALDDAEAAQRLGAAGSNLDTEIESRIVDDSTQGRQLVDDDTVDVYLDLSTQPATAVVREELSDELRGVLNVFTSTETLDSQIERLGGDSNVVANAIAGSAVQIEPLQPPREYEGDQLALGVIAGVLIYIALLLNGVVIAQGVVEEKTSRVVELLISTIRPWQLMTGKVVGIGAAGLLQVFVIAGGGAAVAISLDVLSISTSATLGIVAWLIGWFLLGYLFYALLFAAAGALVSRQEEVGGITTPATMLLVIGYVIGVSVLPSDPDNSFVATLSMIPLFSPTLMPMRLAIGGVPAWQAILSVALVAILIPILIRICGRIYTNAIMHTGARVKLGAALRAQS